MVNHTRKINSNFGKQDVIFTEYVVAPKYSSDDNSNNRLYSRVGREFDIDFEDENWESTITSEKIISVTRRLGLKSGAVTPMTRNIILKSIKKKLNLT